MHLRALWGNFRRPCFNIGIKILNLDDKIPRHEPDSLGEKNYKYVLEQLQSYEKQWIGLEYIPKNGTNEGLKWIEEFGFQL